MKMLRYVAAVLALVALPTLAVAQTDAGRISGTVRDSSNAFVADAKVTVTNDKTGEARTVQTNNQGLFIVTPLKPSTYTIKAEKSGFAPIEYPNIPVAVGQELALDFEFHPAGVEEAITVVGTSPVLDLSSARLGVNVSEREVNSLPVNGRQMSQLMLQAPGSTNSGSGTWNDVRFAGRAVDQNAIRYDGIEGSAIIDASPGVLNGEISSPFKLQASLENVQEFRVESSAYPAEYGTGTGGQVSVITKSGSNAIHGSGFEFVRSDKLDAPNFFETSDSGLKSPLHPSLKQNQFGGSFGGPIAKDRAFFFGSFERYQLNAGLNVIEAVPSDAAWATADARVLPLRPGFIGPNAFLLAGQSTNPLLDIYQLQGAQNVTETAFNGRLDFKINNNWSAYIRAFHDQGTNDNPETVAGRVLHLTDNPTNAIVNVQGVLSNNTINTFKFGYNGAPTRVSGVLANPIINGIDFSQLVINTSGSVANGGIAGQGTTTGLAVPGGLVRSNSATNGRGQPYDPYTVSFVDSLSTTRGSNFLKFGGEVRAIRMTTDRQGGVTYTFSNLANFLADKASSVDFNLDVSAPSPYNNGVTGPRHVKQEYYIAYAQNEWRARPDMTLNYGLRYEYYSPLREENNYDVILNIDTGTLKDPSTAFYNTKKNNLLPRVAFTYAPGKTVFRSGFGINVGPGQTEDQIQPVESDRVWVTPSSGAFPANIQSIVNSFNPADPNYNNRNARVRAYANGYSVPERVYQYSASVQQELSGGIVATAGYLGSQGRNLFLRSVANQITGVFTNPDPTQSAFVVRQFSTVQRDVNGNVIGVQNHWAEIDYKTSGGHDQYNALDLQVTKRSLKGLSLNAQYTLGKSTGNTGGSNEADTAANNATTLAQFEYDDGYNKFDVRHTFNFSALYQIPYGRGRAFGSGASALNQVLLGGWEIGTIVNARSGVPVNVLVTRPDILYFDGTNYFTSAGAGRVAVINTPGGGNTRNVRRPDLIPGVDPFLVVGQNYYLNPAAFSIPLPGTFGNLERNSLHGPNFKQADLLVSKKFDMTRGANFEFRLEVFNLFNTVNFSNPVGALPQVVPSNATSEANTLQPGQAFTNSAAGTFGKVTSTVSRTVGLGTSRQVQLGFRLNF